VLERVAQHYAARHGGSRVQRLVHAVRERLSEPSCDLVTGGERAADDRDPA
jgi:hypothetical protein